LVQHPHGALSITHFRDVMAFLVLVEHKYKTLDCTPVLVHIANALVMPFTVLIKTMKIATLNDVCFESKLFPGTSTNGNVGLSRVRV
jgi:hypothetical protein